MSQILTTNIKVDFSSKGLERRLKIEADNRDKSLRNQYLRIYPASTGIVFATTGDLTRSGNLAAEIDETLAFNNSKEVSLGYPEGYSVDIELLGDFYNEDGRRTTTHLSYDSASNIITSSVKGFGVIRVMYKAKYSLYLFKYNGWGCPYESDYRGPPSAQSPYNPFGQDVEEYIPYDDSLVVVYESEFGDYASISLDGPECQYGSGNTDRDSGPGDLVIEVDPEGPIAIVTANTLDQTVIQSGNIEATALLRVYPDVPGDLHVTTGRFLTTTRGLSSLKEEVLKFKFDNGVNLKYPPAGRVTLTQLSSFTDQWDRSKQVLFHQEGDTVSEVNWIGADAFDDQPVDRIVQPGEVIATDTKGRIIKVTGTVKAVYSSTYSLHPFVFTSETDTNGKISKFSDAELRVTYQKPPYINNLTQAGDFSLKGPSIEGNDSYTAPDQG